LAFGVPTHPKEQRGRDLTTGVATMARRDRSLKTAGEAPGDDFDPAPSVPYSLRLLYLGYGTGLRLAEITDAKLGDLKRMAGEGLGDSFWVLKVRGKGQRLREVPLVETVARELRAYLAARALPEPLQGIDRELPLIERLREDTFEAPRSDAPKTTLATSSVYWSLKRFFAACATALEAEGYPHAAVRLRSASTHWLRHTHGTLALKAEIPLTTVRDSLGHANLATSGIYLHEDLVERKRQMERLFGKSGAAAEKNSG
jgi:integrase